MSELRLWRGRRGTINTVICLLRPLPCTFALEYVTVQSTIAPMCTAYAKTHGMNYTDFKLAGIKHASTVVRLLSKPNGGSVEIHFKQLVSFLTSFWVEFAMTPEITIPAFAIFLAILMVAWYRHVTVGNASLE